MNIPATSYPASAPSIIPSIIPIIIGSPNIPNLFCIESGSACILFIPGIFSTNLPTKYPSGANEAVEPVGNAIPSKS